MCNLYSITTNQAAIAALYRVVNRYVGNLAPMPGVFPGYPAPVVRNTDTGRELAMMRGRQRGPRGSGMTTMALAALAGALGGAKRLAHPGVIPFALMIAITSGDLR
jgi:hypothetical protein